MTPTETGRLKIGVGGALGRMGRAIIAAVEAREDAGVAALFDQPAHAGEAIGGQILGDLAEALAASDVVIDFSTPGASVELARRAAEAGITGPGHRRDRRLGRGGDGHRRGGGPRRHRAVGQFLAGGQSAAGPGRSGGAAT